MITWSPTAKLPPGNRSSGSPSLPGEAHLVASEHVEFADVVAAVGEHHRSASIAGGPPVGDEPGARARQGSSSTWTRSWAW